MTQEEKWRRWVQDSIDAAEMVTTPSGAAFIAGRQLGKKNHFDVPNFLKNAPPPWTAQMDVPATKTDTCTCPTLLNGHWPNCGDKK